ncbi:MAG: Lrp/AsnC family transcriptional regulator [Cyclobacteriaceae bacterium]|jgi:Lrp/AsnC family leucine-responsive transcriptional regulator|nr:Lrp/AsnC family transcriptional regulator [Cyclobacteriaceae bacterium]
MELLDDTDKKILRLLQQNARLTNKDLANKLGLSITPVFERVRKLEKRGFIRKYVAVLDNEKLNRGMVVFLHIKMQAHNHESIARLMQEVQQLDEVMECYHVTGETDFLMKVLVPDMRAYEDFVLGKLTRISGIGNINSSIVMREVKHKTEVIFN